MITTSVALLALLLKLAGFVFLFAAALGVLRFADPLQRMHASTKAGTIGAGLMIAGAALASRSAGALVIGALAILFLIFTVPVAGHLLGRAIYLCRAPLQGLEGQDALAGVLPRTESETSVNPINKTIKKEDK
ncbi:potassium:proton antiporter [Corticibacter populi]|uniref:Potassium:proton antiporter n=1 Tax=Corticibacter populi TaxID=1550736 RepID=A0A3M6QYW5_9BURK|nr:monovalent cation/H(+) antiporter subunit G [Corticibacter populi]RMX08204.1 potassium:proton antiporter [Corticibacter populi]RZS35469.1 multisubunit sodium/proton antiporter MrpG subunit [Corticibacter populi]